MVHGLDVVFMVGALLALVALVMVATLVQVPASRTAPDAGEGAELVDGEGFEWERPDLVA
jgi:hypothetical protein